MKSWDSLSEPYRQRLERAGIDRETHARGENLSAARGHGFDREAVIDQIEQYKIAQYGHSQKYNSERSRKNIDRNTETHQKRSAAELRKILKQAKQQARNPMTRDEMLADDDGDWEDFLDADKYH